MTLTLPLHITAFYTGLLALCLLVLSLRVMQLRYKTGIGLGSGDSDALERARRIHGNAAEWVPVGLLMILVLEALMAPLWLLHALGLALLAGRVFHAVGVTRSRGTTIPRAIGVSLSILQYVAGAIACLVYAVLI